MEASGGGHGDIAAPPATVGNVLDVLNTGRAPGTASVRHFDGGRALVMAADGKAVLDEVTTEKMKTLYEGTVV